MIIIVLILLCLVLLIVVIRVIFLSSEDWEKVESVTKITQKYTIDAKDKKRVIKKLRELHPKDFEEFITLLFELSGYSIVYRSQWKKRFGKRIARKDWGIDLICQKWEKKNYIQIKKLINQEVSVNIIREMWWVCADQMYWDNNCTIITTSLFSNDSLLFAKEKNMTLIDYWKLLDIIDTLASNSEKKLAIENFINKSDLLSNTKFIEYSKTCPLCLAPLIKRRWWFYGCMNFYKINCKYTEKV